VLPSGTEDRALVVEVGSFSLTGTDITSLGLITGELITNALKYGQGRVRVEVRQCTSGLHISVSDEGPGFPLDYDPAASRGLGMRLVTSLAKAPKGCAIRVDRSVPFGRIVVATAFGGRE
jgi:two-component sensor histidine kinase